MIRTSIFLSVNRFPSPPSQNGLHFFNDKFLCSKINVHEQENLQTYKFTKKEKKIHAGTAVTKSKININQ